MAGPFQLRPLGVRDILDEAFDLYRVHLARLLTVSFAVALSLQLLGYAAYALLFPAPSGDPYATDFEDGVMISIFLGLLLLAYFIGLGALTAALSRRIFTHPALRPPKKGSRLLRSVRYGFTLLLTLFLYLAGQTALFVLLALLLAAADQVPPAYRLLFSDWIVPVFYLCLSFLYGLLLVFVLPVAVIEGRWGFGAVVRGIRLFASCAPKAIAGLFLIVFLYLCFMLTLVIGMEVSDPTVWAEEEEAAPLTATDMGVTGVFFGVWQALALPLYVNAVVLLYADARVRREGWDLEPIASDLARSEDALRQEEESAAVETEEMIAPPPEGSAAA